MPLNYLQLDILRHRFKTCFAPSLCDTNGCDVRKYLRLEIGFYGFNC